MLLGFLKINVDIVGYWDFVDFYIKRENKWYFWICKYDLVLGGK